MARWGIPTVSILIRFFKWAIPGLFIFIFVFSIQLTVYNCSINFADDWIWTADLWYWKRPLCQLSHNHCPLYSKDFQKAFFLKMGHPWPLFHLFLVFSNKQYNFLTTIKCLKCPSSKRCSDSNSRTPECQSPPITTWPVLLHQQLLRKA